MQEIQRKGKGVHSGEEDLLKYRPNPDMMDTTSAPVLPVGRL
jgi:U3 small nucleolar ribonucleoprotein protein LCP5